MLCLEWMDFSRGMLVPTLCLTIFQQLNLPSFNLVIWPSKHSTNLIHNPSSSLASNLSYVHPPSLPLSLSPSYPLHSSPPTSGATSGVASVEDSLALHSSLPQDQSRSLTTKPATLNSSTHQVSRNYLYFQVLPVPVAD